MDDGLRALLDASGLAHLATPLQAQALPALLQAVVDDRALLLSSLKLQGVANLGDRQKLANALGKLARERGLEPSPAAVAARAAKNRVVLPAGPVELPAGRRGLTELQLCRALRSVPGAGERRQHSGLPHELRPPSPV